MKAFFVAIGTALYERVWLSYRSTILGLGVACIGEALNYTLNAVPDPRIHALCAFLTTIFIAWKDRKVAEGKIKMLVIFLALSFGAYAQGSPTARTAAANAAIGTASPSGGATIVSSPHALYSGGTLADVAPSDPPPAPAPSKSPFSGCSKNGKVCFGLTLALSVTAINLSKKIVEGAFAPGAGVGVTFNPGTWSSFGVDVYLNADPGAQNASAAIMLKVLNGYARAGYSQGFIGDTSKRLLFGTGVDL